jgi:hypothetical protein
VALIFHLLSFLFFRACCAHGALACQEKQGGLDRTVEAMCQNVTKNSERQPERQKCAAAGRQQI